MPTYDYTKNLTVGSQLAENDKLLSQHFIDIRANRFVGHGDHSIILGRKGAGKSALRLHFHKTASGEQRVISLEPSAKDLHDAFQFLENERAIFSVEFISELWDIAAFLNLARLAYQDYNSVERDPDEFKKFPERIRKAIYDGARYGIGRTLDLVENDFADPGERRRFGRNLRSYVRRVIPLTKKTYYILIDSVDDIIHNSYDTTKRNDLFATFFEGLLSFFQEFTNLEHNPLSSIVYVHIFMPIDIFDWSVSRHADKLRGYKHHVSWETGQLDDFITSRLSRNLSSSQQNEIRAIKDDQQRKNLIWDVFFPSELRFVAFSSEGKIIPFSLATRDVLIGMTLLRPRDLQEIVTLIYKKTQEMKLVFPDESVVFRALDQYSSELKQSVEMEYGVVLPELKDILSQLSGNTPNISKNLLVELIGRVVGQNEDKIYKAMNIMFNSCILGAIRKEEFVGNKEIFYYDFSDFGAIWMYEEFIVHRAFWHSLHLSYPRSRRAI